MPRFIFIPSATSTFPIADILSEYKFENNVLDTVGSEDGSATSLTYASGLVGQTGVFNGSSSRVLMPGDFIPYFSEFSFTILLKATDTLSEYRAFGFANNTNMPFILLRLNNSVSGRIGLLARDNVSAKEIITDAYTPTSWTHVTGTFVENGDMKLYVNGTLISTLSILDFATISGNNTIGSNRNGNGQFFKGDLDCLRIWKKELTASEVSTIATAELAGTDINP
tara:strand:+ start:18 stop:692 length:675 start_codon:yes stop_codon:yes gene_type:complete